MGLQGGGWQGNLVFALQSMAEILRTFDMVDAVADCKKDYELALQLYQLARSFVFSFQSHWLARLPCIVCNITPVKALSQSMLD